MTDALLLALTALLTWGMWRLLCAWGALGACWLWGWGMWFVRELSNQ